MNTGQIGMFFVKMDSTSEEADVGGKIGDKDIVDEVQGDNKGVFQELLREYVDIFKNELDEAPHTEVIGILRLKSFHMLLLQLVVSIHCPNQRRLNSRLKC